MIINIVDKVVINKVDLKALRMKARLSQEGLAQKAGISFITMNRLENGYYDMPAETWKKIEKILNKHTK